MLSAVQVRYREKHGERIKTMRRLRYATERTTADKRRNTPEGWAKDRIRALRYKAKKLGLVFDITWEDIIPPSVCPVLGTPLTLVNAIKQGRFASIPTAASVDRRFNHLGYVKDNVRVISTRANLLKKDANLEEISLLFRWMEKECAS